MHLEHLLTCTIDKNILLKCKGKDALKVFDIITLTNKIKHAEKAINSTVPKYCSANFKFKGKDALKVSGLAKVNSITQALSARRTKRYPAEILKRELYFILEVLHCQSF